MSKENSMMEEVRCDLKALSTRFYIRSKFCGTLVSNRWYDEKEADKRVMEYNKEAIDMDSEVRYEKVRIIENGC